MNTIIIGLSGKKQSGKNTICENIKEYICDNYGENSCHIYSFADSLKRKICMDVMGLSYEQCFGTDEQKNTFTIYKWENLPDEIRYQNECFKQGFITAREIMQLVGTDIFRKYFSDSIWVNATFRDIEKNNHKFALIADARFPSEVEGVVNKNGYVIRLTRDICNKDAHDSETALDNYNWNKFKDNIFLLGENIDLLEQKDISIDIFRKHIEINLEGEK